MQLEQNGMRHLTVQDNHALDAPLKRFNAGFRLWESFRPEYRAFGDEAPGVVG